MNKKELEQAIKEILEAHEGESKLQLKEVMELLAEEGFFLDEDEDEEEEFDLYDYDDDQQDEF